MIIEKQNRDPQMTTNLPAPTHQQKQLGEVQHYCYPEQHIMFKSGLWIRIHLLRIRIKQFFNMRKRIQDPDLNPDPGLHPA